MSDYAPFDVTYDCAAFGLFASDRPSPLGNLRVYAAALSDRAVVFLHGVGQSWASWTPVLEAARELQLDTSNWVVLDLPGFGHSADLPGEVSLESVGTAILAMLAELGLKEVTLVGHSMGGFLALDMLARASVAQPTPALEGAVVLSGAYAGIVDFVNTPLSLARRRPGVAAASTGMWLASLFGAGPARLVARSKLALAVIAPFLKPVSAHPRKLPQSFIKSLMLEVRPRAFRIAARTGVDYDCAEVWSKISLPVTAVFGAADHLVDDEDRRALEVACPSATVVVLPETGHFTPIERPHEVAGLVAGL